MIDVIVAGAGQIGARHITHVQAHPRTRLAAVIEPSAEIATPVGVPRFDRLEDVDVAADAVIIATPNATHEALGRLAVAQGLAVLVEKPMTAKREEAERLVAAAEAAGVPLLVGYHRRHHPKVTALKAALAEGRIGQPVGASLIWSVKKPAGYFDVPWRRGPGGSPTLINLTHEINFMQFLFGTVAEVTGLVTGRRQAGAADTGAVALRFDSGVLVTMLYSDNAPSPWGFEAGTGENPDIAALGLDCLRIIGTEGAAAFPSLQIFSGAADWSEPQTVERLEVTDKRAPLDIQLDHFCDTVESGAVPMTSGREALETLLVALEVEAGLG